VSLTESPSLHCVSVANRACKSEFSFTTEDRNRIASLLKAVLTNLERLNSRRIDRFDSLARQSEPRDSLGTGFLRSLI
jgi:hypothetical protein